MHSTNCINLTNITLQGVNQGGWLTLKLRATTTHSEAAG